MDLFVLKDGTRLTIRPIRPQDKGELTAALGRLSEATVHKRFMSPKTSFSAAELRYLTEVDGHHHVALVAEETEAPHRIVAVARYVAFADDPTTADVAIVVGDAIQGQGLGRCWPPTSPRRRPARASGASPPRCWATTAPRTG